MAKSPEQTLEQRLSDFKARYEQPLQDLMRELDAACISHYSSGFGTKRISFELFPASSFIRELLTMLHTERYPRQQAGGGLRDVTQRGSTQNPATDFLLFLQRWTGFAEQVMKREGDSEAGIAAARAKLMMEKLQAQLSEGKPASARNEFALLMEAVGLTVQARAQRDKETQRNSLRQQGQQNYHKALAAVQAG